MTIKIEQIRNIELGPRQIYLFEDETDTVKEQNRVRDYLFAEVELHGHVYLSNFVPSAEVALGLHGFKILQHLFWLANDLEIHFRKNGKAIPAHDAKQIFIDSPDEHLKVLINKPVEESVILRAKRFFKQVSDAPKAIDALDQHEFARRLLRKLMEWQWTLESCRAIARQPGFPGEKHIDEGLSIIRSISIKLDAFSLIHAFCANTEPLGRLAEEINVLSTFYSEEAGRWDTLIAFADACKNTIAEKAKEPSIAEAYEQFKIIISSPRPYDRVDDAWQLYSHLKSHHDRIVAQRTKRYREVTLSKIESLILDMKKHLDMHAAEAELRNHALFALRIKIRSINESNSIERIKIHEQAAEEAFEIFLDEVAAQ